MALVLIEGFDHLDLGHSGSDTKIWQKGWNGNNFGGSVGRNGTGQCLDVIINNGVSKLLPSSYSTFILGCAIKLSAYTGPFVELRDTGFNESVGVGCGGGHIQLFDSTNTVIATGTTSVPTSSWFYIELKVTKGSSGSAEVHLNGAPEIAATTGNYGTNNIRYVLFETHEIGGDTLVDDVYGADTTGSSPQNDFLGDIQVRTLYPMADGTYTDWTPDSGTDHYARVNEAVIDQDASYVYDETPGDKDSYQMQPILVTGTTVYGAQLNIGARKGDGGLRQLAPIVRQSGTDYTGSTFTLSTDYLFYSWPMDVDPTNAAWNPVTLNADEFGMETIT